jgi:hypothetical protein
MIAHVWKRASEESWVRKHVSVETGKKLSVGNVDDMV